MLVIGLEELIIDRLAAWQFWDSSVDAVNAFLLVRHSASRAAPPRLRELAERSGVSEALDALDELCERFGGREPSAEDLEEWTKHDFKGER